MTNKITKLMLNWEGYEIREYQSWWQPWANTLVYYNINDNDTNSTIYDLSWNWVDQTWYWTSWYDTDATYGRVATFNGNNYTSAWSIINFGQFLFFYFFEIKWIITFTFFAILFRRKYYFFFIKTFLFFIIIC